MPVTIWLAALVTCPAPLAPTCTMFLPMHESRPARAKAASEPPAMIDRVPAMAPTSPPETGASIKSTPATAKSSPIWRAAAGAMVLMSTATSPGSAALATAHDLGHVGRIGHHGNDQFVTACRVSRTWCDGAGIEQGLHRFGATRPDSDRMAALDEIVRHRAPHDAQADKSDFHAELRVEKAGILGRPTPWSRHTSGAQGKQASTSPKSTTSSAGTGW
jgi:hypothetical protein